jgi:hypothetical protein
MLIFHVRNKNFTCLNFLYLFYTCLFYCFQKLSDLILFWVYLSPEGKALLCIVMIVQLNSLMFWHNFGALPLDYGEDQLDVWSSDS